MIDQPLWSTGGKLLWSTISGIVKRFWPSRGEHGVKMVAREARCHEAKQANGAVATQIAVDYMVTASSHSRLIPAKLECYVPHHGTVGSMMPPPQADPRILPPGKTMTERAIFFFATALGRPRRCTLILTDQFGKRHKSGMRIRYGGPADPY